MSIRIQWVSHCDLCGSGGPISCLSKGTLTKLLRTLGWKIKREPVGDSGYKKDVLTCPTCLAKQREEQQRVVEKVAKMKAEFHPLTSGVMR